MDGRGCRIETLEHGGEYPDMMPQAIRFTDAEGQSAIYLPVQEDEKVVDSKGFGLEERSAAMTEQRFPPPWRAEQIPGGYVVRDANDQAIAYV